MKEGATMVRIKIKDIPKDQKITKEELQRIRGGATYFNSTISFNSLYFPKVESTTDMKIEVTETYLKN